MRIVPLLTAMAVVAMLFLLVFQRAAVLEFAGLAPDEVAAATDTGEAAPAPAEAAGAPEVRRVAVIAVDSSAREIDSAVVLRGRTEAAREVALKAETSGKVVSQPRPKGTLVAAGDLLCEIDIGTRQIVLDEARARLTEAQAQTPSAEAGLTEAQARLTEARKGLDNAEALAAQGFAAETRVIAARAAIEAARAGVAKAKAGVASVQAGAEAAAAAVAQAETELARTRIHAPFAGVLESDTAELGALLQPGSPCATVIALDPIRLVGFVPELDVDRVSVGAAAGARLASGRQVTGKVTFLSRAADPATRTFRVEAEVANPDLSIRDGQTAEILVQSTGRMAHLLPQSALTLADDGTLGVRVVAKDEAGGDIARFVPVELLRDSQEGVWVAGLDPTARVIVEGQDYVTDGVALDVTMRESGS